MSILSGDVVVLIESDAYDKVPSNTSDADTLLLSCAISLKRIADRLDGEGIKAVLNTLAQHPVNAYGEGFADAIQNGIERGKRGINSHDR